ncbi:MAG: hypothetical protein ACPGWR_29495 [Ardenticatenaceae bacterium]
MQTLEDIKSKGQESLNNLVDLANQQPEPVRTWGVTAGGAVAGALALGAASKVVLAVASALATPPISLTIGAVAGGLLGWNLMQQAADGSVPVVEVSRPADAEGDGKAA